MMLLFGEDTTGLSNAIFELEAQCPAVRTCSLDSFCANSCRAFVNEQTTNSRRSRKSTNQGRCDGPTCATVLSLVAVPCCSLVKARWSFQRCLLADNGGAGGA